MLMKRQRVLAMDTLLGILSHSALALGLVTVGLVTGAAGDHMDLLFGDILTVTWRDVMIVWAGGALVLAVLAFLWRDLIAISVHEELAQAEGVNVQRVELGFILLIARDDGDLDEDRRPAADHRTCWSSRRPPPAGFRQRPNAWR